MTSGTDVDEVSPGHDVPRSDFVGDRAVGVVLLIAGLVGFVAAFILTVEKFLLLTNPFYRPSCSINEQLSCATVMGSPQAAVFGFPNPLLGIAGFAVVATTGVVLATGSRLPRWYWWALQAGALFGIIFVHWLMWQSIAVIGALCPYCMGVWGVMIVVFVYITLRNLDRAGPDRSAILGVALRSHWVVAAAWILAVAAVVVATSL